MSDSSQTDVVIIGAGIAGLAAARELSAARLRVRIIEARHHIGGRIRTLRDVGHQTPIEFGAEFVHGTPPELLKLIREASLDAAEIEGESWCWRDGRLAPCREFERIETGLDEVLKRAPNVAKADVSFQALLDESFREAKFTEAKRAAVQYVEGFHAAHAGRIGVQGLVRAEHAADEIEGHRSFRLLAGYDRIAEYLRGQLDASADVCLNHVVKAVRWGGASVEVAIEANADKGIAEQSFVARCAIITLPLGVLKARAEERGAVRFSPSLPSEKTAALDKLEVGEAVRVSLRFRERWWTGVEQFVRRSLTGDAERMNFLFTRDLELPTWWTSAPSPAPILTGWAGGHRAAQFAGKSESHIMERAIATLARIFDAPRAVVENQLVAAHSHDWTSDAFTRGSYSYIGVGGIRAPQELVKPIDGKLFLAGEAMSTTGHTGTVHGALQTGMRAARQVIRAFNETSM